jgi:hypothetical protein
VFVRSFARNRSAGKKSYCQVFDCSNKWGNEDRSHWATLNFSGAGHTDPVAMVVGSHRDRQPLRTSPRG